MDQRVHRTLQRALEVWRGTSLAARREAEAALCGIQRHAQHGLGRSRRGNAAASSAGTGRGKSLAQRDVPESGLEPRLFRRCAPGISSGHLSAVSVPRSEAAPRRSRLRRVDVQKQIRGCAHHDVHRRAGNCFGRKQIVGRLWSRSGPHEPDAGEDVRPLLPPFFNHHAKRGIAGGAQQTGSGERSRHGHGMDVRAAPAGVRPQGTT